MPRTFYLPNEEIDGLGATLYHLLCGRAPYEDEASIMTILTKKIVEDPIDPQEYNPELSDRSLDLIKRFMSRDRDARPANWTEAIRLMKKF